MWQTSRTSEARTCNILCDLILLQVIISSAKCKLYEPNDCRRRSNDPPKSAIMCTLHAKPDGATIARSGRVTAARFPTTIRDHCRVFRGLCLAGPGCRLVRVAFLTYVYIYTHIHNTYIHTYTYRYRYTDILHIYIYMYVYVHTYIHIYNVYVCIYIYIYIDICMCIYIYIYSTPPGRTYTFCLS